MKRYTVVYSERANTQLLGILNYITEHATVEIATKFVDAVREHCDSLATFPHRGRIQDSKREIRCMGFRRTVTILFRIGEDVVDIAAIHYRGRNIRL